MSIHFLSADAVRTQLSAKNLNDLTVLRDTLPLFNHVRHYEIDDELLTHADHFKSFKDVIVLGTGGSSLGGKSLCEFANDTAPDMHFCDNIDPKTFKKMFRKINPETTGVIVISKSGSTAETLMQFMICLDHWKKHTLTVANHFIAITEPTNNTLGKLAAEQNIPCLAHATDIGGRFAVFTNVGILPALVAGVDVGKFLKGAKSCLHKLDDNIPSNPAITGALAHFDINKSISVLMPYIDQLNTFALWYRQLWAESLGKNGKGTTPIAALGTVDQHSQLQLFLDGPKDKYFTVITTSYDKQDDFAVQYTSDGLSLYQGHTMGELMEAEQQATIDTLKNNGCPVRHIHLDIIDEYALGYLMMHYVIETLAMASILEVNAFDQPAVEEGKILTRQYLAAA